ncbi:MAG: site-specific integrase [Elusimicrobia bacterium]|nr:site-specific integrase [Elusimicrobiota bacterium]
MERCSDRIRPIIMCALLTGMRKGEILNLRWENLDLDHNIIYVLDSKSGKPREIPIAPQLQEVFIGLGRKASGNVFEVPEITLRRQFGIGIKAAGITGFRFHDLRHTFASYFVMKTGDLPALQRLLGHSSPMMTQRYAHLSQSHLTAGIRLLDFELGHKCCF